jgi:hypothetical protein
MGKSITDLSSVTTVGLDLAKHVFQVHGIDASGRVIVAKALRRKDVRFRANMAREPDQSVLLYRRGPESGCLGENFRAIDPALRQARVRSRHDGR